MSLKLAPRALALAMQAIATLKLECPVFGSIFCFDCSQAFSGAGRRKNQICQVSALLVEFFDYTSPSKLQKLLFWGQKMCFRLACVDRVLKICHFLLL